jgi:cytochrome c oxidase subunit II
MFANTSNYVKGVDTAFVVIFSIIIFFLVALTVTLIIFIFRYHEKRNPKPTYIEGNNKLELIWTIIPLFLVLGMFWFGWAGWKPMNSAPPKDSIWIETTARMWNWSFKYDNGKNTQKLYVPAGKPVALDLKALDVIHSLYIPAFRLKKDVVPGKKRNAWFVANSPGTYDLFCTEYCGLQHSTMITTVEVLPEKEYNEWYKSNVTEIAEAEEGEAATPAGLQIIKRLTCNACHSIDGTKIIGPSYKGIYGKEIVVITDGRERTVKVDDEYIKRSILDPGADVVKGYPDGQMTSYKGQLTDDELNSIIEYIKSLQ